jgi:hypothetical protein
MADAEFVVFVVAASAAKNGKMQSSSAVSSDLM